MTLPMIVLGVLAVVAGYVNTPWFGTFLTDYLAQGPVNLAHGDHHGPFWIPVAATGVSLLGIFLAYLMYAKKSLSRDWLSRSFPSVSDIIYNKWFVDEAYDATFVKGTKAASRGGTLIDRYVVEGAAEGTVSAVQLLAKSGNKLQDGKVQTYGTAVILGMAVIFAIIALTGGYFS
jgi:NADH-quinone oxidoreductase subunit L